MLAMKMTVKKACVLCNFNTTGHTNNTIRHTGGRICIKCIRNTTILFNDTDMCLDLNPDFGSHTEKFLCVFFLLTFDNFPDFIYLKILLLKLWA